MSSLIQTPLPRPASTGPLAVCSLVYVSFKVRTSCLRSGVRLFLIMC